jgi:hypothetical protein
MASISGPSKIKFILRNQEGFDIMPKVKIFIASDSSTDHDDYYSRVVLRQGITDWEEISDDDLVFLRENLHYIVDPKKYGYSAIPLIISQDEYNIIERIDSIKDRIRIETDRRNAEQEAARKKREASQRKKELAKKAKTEAEELALLDALREKYKTT